MKIDRSKRISDNLKKYDYLANNDDFVSIVEWANQEGVDVTFNDDQIISLTYGKIDAINYLINTLRYSEDDSEGND